MRITDYETTRSLSDVCITLTSAEAEELASYLRLLVSKPEVQQVHLSELDGNHIGRELTVKISP